MRGMKVNNCPFETIKQKKLRLKKSDSFLELAVEWQSERKLRIMLPLRTVSEANCFEAWQKKAQRHKDQKLLINSILAPLRHRLSLPCRVTFVRYAKKELDRHDNLPISNKFLADQIASILTDKRNGKGDNDPRLSWCYDQVKSESYGVEIFLEFE